MRKQPRVFPILLSAFCVGVFMGQDDCGTQDLDGDGYAPVDGDCDDRDPNVNPGVEEVCADGVDNNCDGQPGDCGFSTSTLLSDFDLLVNGGTDGDLVGASLASAGDLNGDGADDFVLGAPGADSETGSNVGAAYVFFGPMTEGAVDVSVADGVIIGGWDSLMLGWKVIGTGDMNGDGLGDLAVSAMNPDSDGVDSGIVYVCNGPFEGVRSVDTCEGMLTAEAAGDAAGQSLDVADLNGDGTSDLLIGAPGNDGLEVDGGSVYVVYGPVVGELSLGNADAILRGADAAGMFGASAAAVGDINGDGVADVLVGAPEAAALNGAAMLFYGPMEGVISSAAADTLFTGVDDEGRAGWIVTTAGDINDDGVNDLVITAPYGAFRTSKEVGQIFVWMSPIKAGTLALGDAPLILHGEQPAEHAGASTALLGDVTGSGEANLAVGAYGTATGPGAHAPRKLYVVCHYQAGNVSLMTACTTIEAEADGTDVGRVAGDVGDINGDGMADFALGLPEDALAETWNGGAYVFFGRAGM